MRRESFYAKGNRSGNLLHVETDGAIVNIRVGVHDSDGNPVTVVDVMPDDETRSPDIDGHYWHTEDADGNDTRGAHIRVVRQPKVTQGALARYKAAQERITMLRQQLDAASHELTSAAEAYVATREETRP